MFKTSITVSSSALVLGLTTLGIIVPPAILAQSNLNDNPATIQQPVNNNSYNPVIFQQADDVNRDDAGFDWRWLLPLAMLPFVLLLFTRDDEPEVSGASFQVRREYRTASRAQVAFHDIDIKRKKKVIESEPKRPEVFKASEAPKTP